MRKITISILIFLIIESILIGSISSTIALEENDNYQIINSTNPNFDIHRVNIPVKLGDYEIKNTKDWDDITLINFGQINTPGQPKLPTKIISIAIPPNTIPIKFSYLTSKPIKLNGTYKLKIA